ncbi:4Fe-4S ferredoxin [Clostridium carboxidivorans P7]|uniref:4Fe-4S ferredoxin iron-sulfur binding domain protein n=1 Tax=Clostridium carboxidivorans P7 TaxID=536227 RepID=C6PWT4_9CLOT|nr:4Fe-4S dicluster domain-containing protein [Clostridium carboxidivorans]AKN31984.1 4Fe-4S ferredoxin [Clostridium carboxidivorans P7]EET86309.1 4Fe-4S ferredoxin iron-sulfur binding domain protein [Clostridium carboxidivorans P7]EFG87881.1 putative dimethylsulfoxide reductase, chain B [Clostridium carboxidivorans P7]
MGQKGFFFNMELCIACKACQIACKDKNDLDVGILFREVKEYEGGKFPNPWLYFISMACNHCANPACVKACPTGACNKRKEDGIVVINKEKCVGCRKCVKACPYGQPKYLGSEVKKSGKCDMCIDLLEKGEEPACVSACATRALQAGELQDLKKYNGVSEVKGLPSSKITNPSLVIKPKKCALK